MYQFHLFQNTYSISFWGSSRRRGRDIGGGVYPHEKAPTPRLQHELGNLAGRFPGLWDKHGKYDILILTTILYTQTGLVNASRAKHTESIPSLPEVFL